MNTFDILLRTAATVVVTKAQMTEKICFHFFPCLFSTVLPYSPYWILSTDYTNVALVYSCTDILRLFHVDFAWILGRTRTLPDSTIVKAKEIFANNNIDVIRMMPSKQQGCDKTLWAANKLLSVTALMNKNKLSFNTSQHHICDLTNWEKCCAYV